MRGLYTTAQPGLPNTETSANFARCKRNPCFRNFQVEKRREPPYRTRSYLPGGAASGNRGSEEAGCPPVFLGREARKEHAVDFDLASGVCGRGKLVFEGQRTLRRSAMESSKPAQNIQDSFLNTARKERLNITIYLLSGVKLTGRIRSFDKYSVVLEASGQEQLIFKHAISTVAMGRGAHGHVDRPMAVAATGSAPASSA